MGRPPPHPAVVPSHVCFVMPPYEVFGPDSGLAIAIIAAEVARELEGLGVETSVITPDDGTPLYSADRVIRLKTRSAGALDTVARRAAARMPGSYDLAHQRYLRQVDAAIRRSCGTADVFVFFNDLDSGARLSTGAARVYTWLQNEVELRGGRHRRHPHGIDGILAVSGYIAASTTVRLGAGAPPVHVVPNGVDVESFGHQVERPPVDGLLRACFVGRIDPNKGPLLAVEAVARARQAGFDVTIDVAGPVVAWGHDRATTDRYVEELDRTLREVGGRRLGRLSRQEVAAFLAQHHLSFVLSLSPEPFGLVALEAMAARCAVIASDRGGLPETCGSGAVLVDPEDRRGLDEALHRLAADPVVLANARSSARRHAEQMSWSRCAARLLHAVEDP